MFVLFIIFLIFIIVIFMIRESIKSFNYGDISGRSVVVRELINGCVVNVKYTYDGAEWVNDEKSTVEYVVVEVSGTDSGESSNDAEVVVEAVAIAREVDLDFR